MTDTPEDYQAACDARLKAMFFGYVIETRESSGERWFTQCACKSWNVKHMLRIVMEEQTTFKCIRVRRLNDNAVEWEITYKPSYVSEPQPLEAVHD